MLHELWIGLEQGASWRARFIGWRQRRSVLRLLDSLWPDQLQTSNAAYQQVVAREGYAVSRLGLFGNVPIGPVPPDDGPRFVRWLPLPSGGGDRRRLVAVTFGALHRQWQPAAAAAWLVATAQRLDRTPALVIVGRPGAHAAVVVDEFRRQTVQVGATGAVEADTVSSLLRTADCGIAAHPWALIGKSGAAAAMLDHGLPVLVPRDDWQLRGAYSPDLSPVDSLLVRLAGLTPADADEWLDRRRPPRASLPRIADEFLHVLAGAPRPEPAPNR